MREDKNSHLECISYLNITLQRGDEAMPAESAFLVVHSLRFIQDIGMDLIQDHVWNLTRRLYRGLKEAGASVYGNHHTGSPEVQGGIVAFNLYRPDGNLFGHFDVVRKAAEAGFQLLGSCHCNSDFCFEVTTRPEEDVMHEFERKLFCGHKLESAGKTPLGAVRASLGWASTEEDVDSFIAWSKNYTSYKNLD